MLTSPSRWKIALAPPIATVMAVVASVSDSPTPDDTASARTMPTKPSSKGLRLGPAAIASSLPAITPAPNPASRRAAVRATGRTDETERGKRKDRGDEEWYAWV